MKKVRMSLAAVMLAIAGVVAAAAQGPAPPKPEISAAKMALIKEYLDLTVKGQVGEMVDRMLELQRGYARKSVEKIADDSKGLSAADRELVKQLATESSDRMMSRMQDFYQNEVDLETIVIDVSVPVLDRTFTEQELSDLVAFFKTSTGQKTIKTAPKMMVDLISGLTDNLTPKLDKFTRSIVDDETTQLRDKIAKLRKKPAPNRRRG